MKKITSLLATFIIALLLVQPALASFDYSPYDKVIMNETKNLSLIFSDAPEAITQTNICTLDYTLLPNKTYDLEYYAYNATSNTVAVDVIAYNQNSGGTITCDHSANTACEIGSSKKLINGIYFDFWRNQTYNGTQNTINYWNTSAPKPKPFSAKTATLIQETILTAFNADNSSTWNTLGIGKLTVRSSVANTRIRIVYRPITDTYSTTMNYRTVTQQGDATGVWSTDVITVNYNYNNYTKKKFLLGSASATQNPGEYQELNLGDGVNYPVYGTSSYLGHYGSLYVVNFSNVPYNNIVFTPNWSGIHASGKLGYNFGYYDGSWHNVHIADNGTYPITMPANKQIKYFTSSGGYGNIQVSFK